MTIGTSSCGGNARAAAACLAAVTVMAASACFVFQHTWGPRTSASSDQRTRIEAAVAYRTVFKQFVGELTPASWNPFLNVHS